MALTRVGGVLTFISSNTFFCVGSGRALCTYLRDNTRLKTVIDFGDLPIFEATTYSCVLVAGAVQREGWPQPQRSLRRDGWALGRPQVLALAEELRRSGIPLVKYVDWRFYRGITTGLNKAFVIDQATRDRLIAEGPRSAEIIKTWIKGHDIDR